MGVLNMFGLGRIGLVLATAAAAALGGGPASAQTAIKFSLDFKFEGPAAPFVVAIDKGYFKAEGLDVTIDSAGGSLEPINRVASGTYEGLKAELEKHGVAVGGRPGEDRCIYFRDPDGHRLQLMVRA